MTTAKLDLETMAMRAFVAAVGDNNRKKLKAILTETWNAAIDQAVAHCEEVREDRRTHPPAFPKGARKFSARDIAMFQRSAASSCKMRVESLRLPSIKA